MTGGVSETAPLQPGPEHRAARTALIAFLLLATVVWIGIAVGANTRTPGIVGLAAAIFGGLFSAVLTAAIGGWIALKLAQPESGRPRPDEIALADPLLASALSELDRLQRPIIRQRVERAAWRTPVGASIGVAIWSALVLVGAPGGVFDFMASLLIGGLAGYFWTQREASAEAAAAYSDRTIDVLASDAGSLAWRRTATIDAARLRSLGVMRGGGAITADGELSGLRNGVSIQIASITATPPSGADKATGFQGLLIELEAAGASLDSMEQVAATRPAVIALVDQIATLPGLGKPTCAAVGGRLTLVVPETLKPRVFDAPAQVSVRAAAPHLARIRQVIGAVLPIADALAVPA
jgi:hypothetical protein